MTEQERGNSFSPLVCPVSVSHCFVGLTRHQQAATKKIPGPDHPITNEHNPNWVRAIFNNRIIADTTRTLTLREATFPPAQHVPRQDAGMTTLRRTSPFKQCPHKGDASCFNVRAVDRAEGNAVWSYESPYPSVADIKDYVAFYAKRVDAIEKNPF